MSDPRISDRRRRKFLVRLCRGASAAVALPFLRGPLFGQSGRSADAQYHLHPRYRIQTLVDTLNPRTGIDAFVTEKYHDQIAQILAEWTESLRESPGNFKAIEKVLDPKFRGGSPLPAQSRLLRSSLGLSVQQIAFQDEPTLSPEAFLPQLRSTLSSFSKILTAEFQITSIDVPSSTQVNTRVRYEIVGVGEGYFREQRIGLWQLEWEDVSTGYRLRRWHTKDETRSRAAAPSFADVTARAFARNSSYVDQLVHGVDYWRTVLDGACGIDVYGHNGVSVGDIDGDGFDDVYICQPGGLPNRLFRNRGDGTFEDITESSGVGILENTACALIADFDNDGRQDLVVVRANGPLLFLNEGNGKFRHKPDAFRFANPPQGTFTGAAAADYNRDGWLDIYFCLYVYYQGADQYKYPTPYFAAENGPPNFLMRNNGDGTFRDVTAETGLDRNNTRYSFCCSWNNNRNGWPDLYIVNDFGRKNLYRNNGDGTFTDIAAQAGVEDVGAGMSVAWLDYNNDGIPDLYVADMWTAAGERISMQDMFKKDSPQSVRALYQKHAMGNSLFRGRRDGSLEDATASAGAGIGRWSWSSDAWDFDHDGFPDLYVTNGMVSGPVREDVNSLFWRQVVGNSPDRAAPSHDYEQGWSAVNELIRADYSWSGYERNVFYANNRDGTFSDVSGASGLDFIEDGRTFALADFDRDGRQEMLLKNRNGPQLRLLKNVIRDLPPSIAFHLRGVKSNRDAIGATVAIETPAGRQTLELRAGSGFLSQHSKDLFFGLATTKGPVRATIRWPSGLVQELRDLPMNHRISVAEGSEPSRVEPFRAPGAEVVPDSPRTESLPATSETWLLVPVSAPDLFVRDSGGSERLLSSWRGKPVLVNFHAEQSPHSQPQASQAYVSLNSPLLESDDAAGIYNTLYRYLFDRHRDLLLPASFLIDENGGIVKIYQGPVDAKQADRDVRQIPRERADRLAKALPFPGNTATYEFGRNHLSLGSVFFQRGYFDQAEMYFQLALKDDPSSAEAHYGLGSVYLKQNQTNEARASFQQAVRLNASYPDTRPNAWNNLGLLSLRDGRASDAIDCFEEALRADAGHWIALENLGNAYRQQQRWDKARETLERAVAIRPQEPEANYSLAMVYAQTGDNDRAYEYLQRALKLRKDYPEALNNLGVLYLRTQRRDEAVRSFEESIRVAPGFDQAYLNLARVYAIEGDKEKARGILEQLLKQHPDHAQARQALDQLR